MDVLSSHRALIKTETAGIGKNERTFGKRKTGSLDTIFPVKNPFLVDTEMKQRTLGQSGITVSEIGLGCMSMNFGYGRPSPEKDMIELIHKAVDMGVTLFDTAESYGPYINEELVGKALDGLRDKVSIATKCGIAFAADGNLILDARAETLRKSLEGSLKRLRTDHVDIYYLHRVDPKVPVEDVAETMGKFIAEGKIRGWGLSEVGPKTIERAQAVCPLAAVENEFSMIFRESEENGVFDVLEKNNIGFVPYSPLGRGFLTGTINPNEKLVETDFRRNLPLFYPENIKAHQGIIDFIRQMAEAKQATASQIALAWVLARRPWIVPIPGTTKLHRLEENIGAANVVFTEEEMIELNRMLDALPIQCDRYNSRFTDATVD